MGPERLKMPLQLQAEDWSSRIGEDQAVKRRNNTDDNVRSKPG